jgi:hypothetical protein
MTPPMAVLSPRKIALVAGLGLLIARAAVSFVVKLLGGLHKGRPNAEDLRHSEEFAQKLKQNLQIDVRAMQCQIVHDLRKKRE